MLSSEKISSLFLQQNLCKHFSINLGIYFWSHAFIWIFTEQIHVWYTIDWMELVVTNELAAINGDAFLGIITFILIHHLVISYLHRLSEINKRFCQFNSTSVNHHCNFSSFNYSYSQLVWSEIQNDQIYCHCA